MVSREDFYNFCKKKSLENASFGYAGYAHYKAECHDGVSLIKIKYELSFRIRAFKTSLENNKDAALGAIYLRFLNANLAMFNFLTYGKEL